MKTTEILKEAKSQKDDYKIESYDELRSAIESKKLLKEIAGMQFTRWAGILTSLTALVSVLVIMSQAGVNNTKSYKDALDSNIDVLEFKNEGLKEKKLYLDKKISTRTEKVSSLETAINNQQDELNTKSDLFKEIKIKIFNLNKEYSGLLQQMKDKRKEYSQQLDRKTDLSKEQIKIAKIEQAHLKFLNQNDQRNLLLNLALEAEKKKSSDLEEDLKIFRNIKTQELEYLTSFKRETGLYKSSWKRMELTRKGPGIDIDDYTIKLTNVGNRKKNLDLKISEKNTNTAINYFNLDQGNTIVLRFNQAIFFIKIVKAEEEEEEGTIKVLLFKGNKDNTQYRIAS
jgi:hypothetical protein